MSDRHTGVGGDGIILICPSECADFKMRIFNADGSEARMCGNGSRCVGRYVYESRLTDKTNRHLETLSGIKTLRLHPDRQGKYNICHSRHGDSRDRSSRSPGKIQCSQDGQRKCTHIPRSGKDYSRINGKSSWSHIGRFCR